tara:strand:+ start:60 stop:419 length:360 start_codon:yes stop_codon:yes gene_type:complete
MEAYRLTSLCEMPNVYSNEDYTVNISFQSRTNNYVIFNWNHGNINRSNCLTKLINDSWVAFVPTKKRYKIVAEDDNEFIIWFENIEGLYREGSKYTNMISFVKPQNIHYACDGCVASGN